ncbi:MAG: hypothetical protein IT518_15905 [Burkholderiales bacterium]|nr:hypothetical protein [Burkholderiales bacterium]
MQPQTPPINPYGAPQAPVGDHAGDQSIREQARHVSAGHALRWYREAWRLFKVSPGAWIGLWVVLALLTITLSMAPILGGIAVGLLTPVFIGGAMIAARRADREGRVRIGDLFAGFGNRTGPLLLIGLLQMLLSFALGMVVALVALAAVAAVGVSVAELAPEHLLGSAVLGMVLAAAGMAAVVFIPVTYAVWIASCLAALHEMGAGEALGRAFGAVFRNILGVFLVALVTLLLAIVASIPALLGWLVLGPLILCALYAQYRDLFAAEGETARA